MFADSIVCLVESKQADDGASVSHTYRYTRDTKGQHQLRVTFFALKGLGWIDDAPESVMMVEPHGTWDVSDKHVFQVHELVLPA